MAITDDQIKQATGYIKALYGEDGLNHIDKNGESPITKFCQEKRRDGWSEEDIKQFIDKLVEGKENIEKISYYAQANQDKATQDIVSNIVDSQTRIKYVSCAFQNYVETKNTALIDKYLSMFSSSDDISLLTVIAGDCVKRGWDDLANTLNAAHDGKLAGSIVFNYASACKHEKVAEYLSKDDRENLYMAILAYSSIDDKDKMIGIRNIIMTHHHAIIKNDDNELVVFLQRNEISDTDKARAIRNVNHPSTYLFSDALLDFVLKEIQDKEKFFPGKSGQKVLQENSHLFTARKANGSFFSTEEIYEILKTKAKIAQVSRDFAKDLCDKLLTLSLPEDVVRSRILDYLIHNPELIDKVFDEKKESFTKEFARTLQQAFSRKDEIFKEPTTDPSKTSSRHFVPNIKTR